MYLKTLTHCGLITRTARAMKTKLIKYIHSLYHVYK